MVNSFCNSVALGAQAREPGGRGKGIALLFPVACPDRFGLSGRLLASPVLGWGWGFLSHLDLGAAKKTSLFVKINLALYNLWPHINSSQAKTARRNHRNK